MNKLSKLCRFKYQDLLFLANAWLTYLKWDVTISYSPYRYLRKCLRQQTTPVSAELSASIPKSEVHRLIALCEIAGRNHYKNMNCLRRCLTQKQLLHAKHIDSKLHIGVKFEEKNLKAHAWLSYQEEVINDTVALVSTYKELKTTSDQDILNVFK